LFTSIYLGRDVSTIYRNAGNTRERISAEVELETADAFKRINIPQRAQDGIKKHPNSTVDVSCERLIAALNCSRMINASSIIDAITSDRHRRPLLAAVRD